MRRYAFLVIWALLASVSLTSPALSALPVVLDREEFITMLSHVETLKKKIGQNEHEIKLRIAANVERDQLIALQAKHIAELEAIVKKGDEIDQSREAVRVALEAKIDEIIRSMEREQRLSRYKSYGFVLSGILLWVLS